MAAIDKLYVHTYYEYDDIRKWALAYYPELLFYFYDITMTYQQWESNCAEYVKKQMAISKAAFKRASASGFLTIPGIIKYYKENTGYDCPEEQAREEHCAITNAYSKNKKDWKDSYSCAIMSTPFKVDRKLL